MPKNQGGAAMPQEERIELGGSYYAVNWDDEFRLMSTKKPQVVLGTTYGENFFRFYPTFVSLVEISAAKILMQKELKKLIAEDTQANQKEGAE